MAKFDGEALTVIADEAFDVASRDEDELFRAILSRRAPPPPLP